MRFLPTLTFGASLALALGAPALASLHPGDKVNVTVYNHPEISGPATLDASGNISLPLAGTVHAFDAEPADVAERVRAKLDPYVPHVAVDVQSVQQSASLFVAGGPGGSLIYTPGETLTAAVQQALGGKTTQPNIQNDSLTVSTTQLDPLRGPTDLRNVRLVRGGKLIGVYDVAHLAATGEPGPLLQPADTIGFSNKPIAVTVNGSVRDAAVAHLDPNEPLVDALKQAGGIDDVNSAVIMELTRDGKTVDFTTTSPQYFAPAHQGDVVRVPPALHVQVSGNVVKAGEIVLRGMPSLVAALYFAGGPDAYANLHTVQVIHQGSIRTYNIVGTTHGKVGANPRLEDGDTVYVPAGPHADFKGIFQTIVSGALILTHRPLF